jgi:hypothetical protein
MIKFYFLNFFFNPAHHSLRIFILGLFLLIVLVFLRNINVRVRDKYDLTNIATNLEYAPADICYIVCINALNIIHRFFIKNFYLVIFKIFIYCFIHVGFILLIRLYLLGSERELFSFTHSLIIIYQNYIIMFLIILCYIYLIRILNHLLYSSIIQIHIYLYGNDRYIAISDFYKNNYFGYFSDKWLGFATFTSMILGEMKRSNHKYSYIYSKYKRYSGNLRKFMVITKKYLNKNPKKKKTFKLITDFLQGGRHLVTLMRNLTHFLYYLPHLILLLTFIYDSFIMDKFYYINYALLLFFITSINKKIRQFLYEKDPYHDRQLYEYFYGEDNNYKFVYKMLDEWNKKPIKEQTNENGLNFYAKVFWSKETNERIQTMDNNEAVAVYIKENFRVYYAVRGHETFLQRRLKFLRQYIIIIFTLINIYLFYSLYYTGKFTIIIINIYKYLPILFVCLVILGMLILNKYIAVEVEELIWKYNHKCKIIFYILVIIQTIIFIIIFLKNKFILYPDEVIWNYGITILENFTIEEKIIIMYKYLEHILNSYLVNEEFKEYIRYILRQIDHNNLIADNTSLCILREYINNIILATDKLHMIYYKLHISVFKAGMIDYYTTIANSASFLEFYFSFLTMLVISYMHMYLPKDSTNLMIESGKLSSKFISENLIYLFEKVIKNIIEKINTYI